MKYSELQDVIKSLDRNRKINDRKAPKIELVKSKDLKAHSLKLKVGGLIVFEEKCNLDTKKPVKYLTRKIISSMITHGILLQTDFVLQYVKNNEVKTEYKVK